VQIHSTALSASPRPAATEPRPIRRI
jgi:hypothetical protein